MRYVNRTSSRAVFMRGFQPDILKCANATASGAQPVGCLPQLDGAPVPTVMTAASQNEPPHEHTGWRCLKEQRFTRKSLADLHAKWPSHMSWTHHCKVSWKQIQLNPIHQAFFLILCGASVVFYWEQLINPPAAVPPSIHLPFYTSECRMRAAAPLCAPGRAGAHLHGAYCTI